MTDDEAIAQAADKYRKEGYEVVVRPPVETLPAELQTRKAGLVARRDGESVLVEIWSRDRVNDLPPTWMPKGWHFDIVSLPKLLPGDGPYPSPGLNPTTEYVTKLLTELDEYLPRGAARARFLLGWTAAEAAMRVAARREGIDGGKVLSRQLLSELEMAGVLSQDQGNTVRELMMTRNQLAHGYPVDDALAGQADYLIGLARQLLSDERALAAN